jgi:hypothetical protein
MYFGSYLLRCKESVPRAQCCSRASSSDARPLEKLIAWALSRIQQKGPAHSVIQGRVAKVILVQAQVARHHEGTCVAAVSELGLQLRHIFGGGSFQQDQALRELA